MKSINEGQGQNNAATVKSAAELPHPPLPKLCIETLRCTYKHDFMGKGIWLQQLSAVVKS